MITARRAITTREQWVGRSSRLGSRSNKVTNGTQAVLSGRIDGSWDVYSAILRPFLHVGWDGPTSRWIRAFGDRETGCGCRYGGRTPWDGGSLTSALPVAGLIPDSGVTPLVGEFGTVWRSSTSRPRDSRSFGMSRRGYDRGRNRGTSRNVGGDKNRNGVKIGMRERIGV